MASPVQSVDLLGLLPPPRRRWCQSQGSSSCPKALTQGLFWYLTRTHNTVSHFTTHTRTVYLSSVLVSLLLFHVIHVMCPSVKRRQWSDNGQVNEGMLWTAVAYHSSPQAGLWNVPLGTAPGLSSSAACSTSSPVWSLCTTCTWKLWILLNQGLINDTHFKFDRQ